MTSVAMCDDDPEFLSRLAGLLESLYPCQLVIDLFTSGGELISRVLESAGRYDVLLMDVRMPQMSSLDAAREMRRCGCRAPVILISLYEEYAIQGYDIQAFQYLLKPVATEQLRRVFSQAVELAEGIRQQSLLIHNKGVDVALPLADIQYIESWGAKLSIHTASGEYTYWGRLQEMAAELAPHGFFRLQKSYLLNLRYFHKRQGQDIYLIGGTRLRISRKRISALGDALRRRFEEVLLH